jgi:hypothetical protein
VARDYARTAPSGAAALCAKHAGPLLDWKNSNCDVSQALFTAYRLPPTAYRLPPTAYRLPPRMSWRVLAPLA